VLVRVFLDEGLAVGEFVASLRTALFCSSPDSLVLGLGVFLQSAQALQQCGGLFGFVAAFTGFVTDADPAFLNANVG
jgi:hypothetical protein